MELHEEFYSIYQENTRLTGHANFLAEMGLIGQEIDTARSDLIRSRKQGKFPTVKTILALEPILGADMVIQCLRLKEETEQVSNASKSRIQECILEHRTSDLKTKGREAERLKQRKASRAYWLERAQILDMMAEQEHTRNTRECLTDTQLTNFAQNLKTKRKALKMSQGALSRKLEISQSVICSWEKAKSHPTRTWVNRVAEVLGTTAEELLGGET